MPPAAAVCVELSVRAALIEAITPGSPKMWSPCVCVMKIRVIFG